MRAWPLCYTLHPHAKCFWIGGDSIKRLIIELLFFIIDVLKLKKKPQIEISVLVINIYK